MLMAAPTTGKNLPEQDGINLPIKYRHFFPLKSVKDVVNFFRHQLINESDPDITLLSIITGFIEITLTTAANNTNISTTSSNNDMEDIKRLNSFPICTWDCINTLYRKFHSILSTVEKPTGNKRYATKEIIKKISDIIYYSLLRSTYKDRSHIQNLYSYLSVNKLDCFGVALAVVAGCQLLGYKDVHLVISEDHAWVKFATNMGTAKHQQIKIDTIEVTWHGKGNEDKRGQGVSTGVESQSWIYLSGLSVNCDRNMEVVAIVSSINIALTPSSDCLELAEMQQSLLWLLYDFKYLEKYPMALGNLGELEEVQPTRSDVDGLKRPTCHDLYKEAILSAKKFYESHHVYPHTYQAGYFYRKQNYRDAFASWANGACTLGRWYSYSKDDEEIYKEFLEIANELIPIIMKQESSGISARSIVRDSESFANLLRFYDGICQWEEGSMIPIWHIGWAKPMVQTISKFEYDIRSQVIIKCENDTNKGTNDIIEVNNKRSGRLQNQMQYKNEEGQILKETDIPEKGIEGNNNNNNNNIINNNNNNNNNNNKDDCKSDTSSTSKKLLADITAACGEKILNPEYLLQGGGELFSEKNESSSSSSHENGIKSLDVSSTIRSFLKNELEDDNTKLSSDSFLDQKLNCQDDQTDYLYVKKNPIITLYSQKMKGLKDLLVAEKLNTHAVLLVLNTHVTAQSPVTSLKKPRACDKSNLSTPNEHVESNLYCSMTSRPKRSRRD